MREFIIISLILFFSCVECLAVAHVSATPTAIISDPEPPTNLVVKDE